MHRRPLTDSIIEKVVASIYTGGLELCQLMVAALKNTALERTLVLPVCYLILSFIIILDVQYRNVNCLSTYGCEDLYSSDGILGCPYAKIDGDKVIEKLCVLQ